MTKQLILKNNNQRLFKNTLLLYIRMFLTMGISLLTPRLLLKNLGVEGFGLLNVIGNMILMCNIFAPAMGTAANRFLSYELANNNLKRVRQIFSLLLEIFIILSFLTFIAGELFGTWYMKNKLVISDASYSAGVSFMHATVIITATSMLITPYSALLIAHENMKAFSVLSIIEVIFHFLAAFFLQYITADRLRYYGYLYVIFQLVLIFNYYWYCRRTYREARLQLFFNKSDIKELLSFISWNMFGNIAWMLSETLSNLLLNSFFGPIVNAAKGIASQLFSYLSKFMFNFLTAARPQIIKYWAAGQFSDFERTVIFVSRIGYLLLLICIAPVILEMPTLLSVWLGKYPEWSISFAILTLACALIKFFTYPITYGVQASGKLKLYETVGNGSLVLTFPVAWVFLRHGAAPYMVLVVNCCVNMISLILCIYIFKLTNHISIKKFLKEVYIPLFIVTVFTFAGGLLILYTLPPVIWRLVVTAAASALFLLGSSFVFVLKTPEKQWVISAVFRIYHRFCGKLSF